MPAQSIAVYKTAPITKWTPSSKQRRPSQASLRVQHSPTTAHTVPSSVGLYLLTPRTCRLAHSARLRFFSSL